MKVKQAAQSYRRNTPCVSPVLRNQVAPINKLSLALTVVLAAVFLGEALTWKAALGAGLILAGTLVMIWK